MSTQFGANSVPQPPTSGADTMATTTTTAATAVPQGGQQFPEKVFHMIEHCHVERPHIAQWDLSEGGFKVYDVDSLIRDVFPQWEFINPSTGHPISFSSFQRQLNGYSFAVRIDSKSPTTRVIRHRQDLFKRNHLDQVRLIQKKGVSNAPASGSSDTSASLRAAASAARSANSSPAASTSSGRSSFSSSSSASTVHAVTHACSASRHHMSTVSTGSDTASITGGCDAHGNEGDPQSQEEPASPSNATNDRKPKSVDTGAILVRIQRLSNLVVKGTNMVLKRHGAKDEGELLTEEDGMDDFEGDEENMEKLLLNGPSFFEMEEEDDAHQPHPIGSGLPTLQEEDEENDEEAPANYRVGGLGVTAEMQRLFQAAWQGVGGGGNGADTPHNTHQLLHSPPPLPHGAAHSTTVVSPSDSPDYAPHHYMDFTNVTPLPHIAGGGNKRSFSSTAFGQNGRHMQSSSSHKQQRRVKHEGHTNVFVSRNAGGVRDDVKHRTTQGPAVVPGAEHVVSREYGVEQNKKKKSRSTSKDEKAGRRKVLRVNVCGSDVAKPFEKDGDSNWIVSSSALPGITHTQRNLMIRGAFVVGILMVFLQINILILLWYTRQT